MAEETVDVLRQTQRTRLDEDLTLIAERLSALSDPDEARALLAAYLKLTALERKIAIRDGTVQMWGATTDEWEQARAAYREARAELGLPTMPF